MATSIWTLPHFSLRFKHVWRRNLLVWRKLAIPSMLGNLADPLLYMFGLGYGLGRMPDDVGGMHGIPVHRRGRERRQALGRHHILGGYTSVRLGQRKLERRERVDRLENAGPRLVDRDQALGGIVIVDLGGMLGHTGSLSRPRPCPTRAT